MSDDTASNARVGCADIPAGVLRDRYMSRLDFLELARCFDQLPKPSVLRKRRESAPDGFGLGLVAPRLISHRPPTGARALKRWLGGRTITPEQLEQAGGYRDTPLVRATVDRLVAGASAAEAETVVFRTAVDFAPSAGNRDLLRRFFTELAPAERFGGALRVWSPEGLWETPTAVALAEELELVLAVDPLASGPVDGPMAVDPMVLHQLPGGQAYFRMVGLGQGGQLPDHVLDELAALADSYQRCWFVLATGSAFRDASNLRKRLG